MAASPGASQDSRPTLQELLREMRERRDAELVVLAPRVKDAVARLDALGARVPRRAYESALAELGDLGDVAVPLFADYLDPGSEPDPSSSFRASEIALLLEELPTLCILDQLLTLAEGGSPEGRLNAVRVLGSVDARDEVGPALERLITGDEPAALQAAALRSLARLGGERSIALLRRSLVEAKGEPLESALIALSEGKVADAAPEVLAVVRDVARAGEVAVELANFFVACPETVDEAVTIALLELVRTRKPSQSHRLTVLRQLRKVDHPRTTDVRGVLREIAAAAAGTDVADAALVSLSLMGDSRSRRQLLDSYDLKIEKNDGWAQAYIDRGTIFLRLGDHPKAQRDFRDAVGLLREKNQPARDVWILLARSLALDGKHKNAADALRSAALTHERLLELRDDPDFAELAANSRHGKVFPQD